MPYGCGGGNTVLQIVLVVLHEIVHHPIVTAGALEMIFFEQVGKLSRRKPEELSILITHQFHGIISHRRYFGEGPFGVFPDLVTNGVQLKSDKWLGGKKAFWSEH